MKPRRKDHRHQGHILSGDMFQEGGKLTVRERQVIALAALGLTTKEIAAKLYLSRETVKTHLRHIQQKLGTRSRSHSVYVAIDRGWLTTPSLSAGKYRFRPLMTKPGGEWSGIPEDLSKSLGKGLR